MLATERNVTFTFSSKIAYVYFGLASRRTTIAEPVLRWQPLAIPS